MPGPYITQTQVAVSIPFDNSTNGFSSTDVQSAIEESAFLLYLGDGSDGNVTLSSGTTTLQRTMYYNNLTLNGTAIVDANGYKIYVKGALNISGSASIIRTPNNGGAASGQTAGSGATAPTQNDVGAGSAGQTGATGASGGLGGSSGIAGIAAGTAAGYGGAGGASGVAGSGAAGAAGTYTNVPERVLRHDHIYRFAYKLGGQGGAGGAGGSASALGTGGGGGGGGSGGSVIEIFTYSFNNTSSVGIVTKGGNGGAGGTAPSGNSTGGGGGGGGGGGHIWIACHTLTAAGTLNVSGGSGGVGGGGSGSGSVGGTGSSGSNGHTTIYVVSTNSWTTT